MIYYVKICHTSASCTTDRKINAVLKITRLSLWGGIMFCNILGECGGSVVECRTPEREVGGSKPITAVLCPWARHFTPRKYWLITQEAVAPSRHDWKIVDWDVKPQHNQPTNCNILNFVNILIFIRNVMPRVATPYVIIAMIIPELVEVMWYNSY